MIRGKRYRGRELEIKHVLTCLASPKESGPPGPEGGPSARRQTGRASED